MSAAPAVRVVGLEKNYGSRRALDGLSFEVAPGEVFGLLGPNGAGKTTTVEILEGFRRADGGSSEVLGLDPAADSEALRAQIGVMLQEGGLYPGLRAGELLRLFAAYYEDPEDPEALLAKVGLTDSARTTVRRLSGGQRQRLSLACALVGKPRLVFLDEPTAGMDPHARATTWQLVRDLAARGTTVLLTTHAMDEAEHLCDRVAIVQAGRIAALGTPSELTTLATAAEVRFRVDRELDGAELAGVLGVTRGQVQRDRDEYVVRVAASPELIARLARYLSDRGVMLGELRAGRRSLEAVFLQLTTIDGYEPEPAVTAAHSGAKS